MGPNCTALRDWFRCQSALVDDDFKTWGSRQLHGQRDALTYCNHRSWVGAYSSSLEGMADEEEGSSARTSAASTYGTTRLRELLQLVLNYKLC